MIGDGNLKNECKKFVKKNKLKNISLLDLLIKQKSKSIIKLQTY